MSEKGERMQKRFKITNLSEGDRWLKSDNLPARIGMYEVETADVKHVVASIGIVIKLEARQALWLFSVKEWNLTESVCAAIDAALSRRNQAMVLLKEQKEQESAGSYWISGGYED
ncbi:uncharacterized protein KY384_005780 [Bacidia gigantensis]|uniref:uncharacterized protein n=1 Tax=Bacidia gigantensis TaxID=2732470 RepID=UPI001D05603F|nr:uncharacterized protein KY384_005780 [Bacidia gigantensis]KAG8529145.1 hypothetical protein KY384_005780 [Bacidia gigantensis]